MDVSGERSFVATAVSDRKKMVMSDDGKLRARIAGEDGQRGASPDQVFAAGYAACFNETINDLAREREIATGAVWVTARVQVRRHGRLHIQLVIEFADLSATDASDLVRSAYDACPYSQAMHGNVDVDLRVA
ncbi:MAG: Ohr family peroxiredoxin [Kofleriaceae bacterium]|nr:Ohr family peroxiredoxin [Kofleriaceae bacterium]